MNRHYLRLAISTAAAAILFAGCGGGGGSSEPTLEDATISTKAVDGYLMYSTVCLDLNGDGACNPKTEPTAFTDESGSASLTITAEHQKNPNFAKASLLVYGGLDADTKNNFEGKLKSPVDLDKSSVNITPATTLVAKMVEKGSAPEEAKKKVAEILGVKDAKLIEEDPIALANNNNDRTLLKSVLKLQKSLENLASTQEDPKDALDKLYDALASAMEKVNSLKEAIAEVPKTQEAKSLKIDAKAVESAQYISETISKMDTTSAKELAFKANATKDLVEKEVLQGSKSLADVKSDIESNLAKDFKVLYAERLLNNIGYDESDFDDMAKRVAKALESILTSSDTATPEQEIKALKDAKLTKVASMYESYLKLKQTQAEASTTDGVAISLPFTFYDFDIDRGEFNEIEEIVINIPKLSGYEYEYNLSTNKWDKHSWDDENEDEDLIMLDGKWVKDPNKISKISDTEFAYNDKEHFKVVKEVDLTKDTSLLPPKFKNMKFSTGAEGYIISFKNTGDLYQIWEKVKTHGNASGEYYTSLEDFIKAQSGDRWFSGDHNGGVAFEKAVSGTLKAGDTGNLVKVERVKGPNGEDLAKTVGKGGTWKVVKLPNNALALIIDNFESEHDDNLFTIKDGVVWRGEYDKATNEWKIDDELSFNKVAAEDLKKYILANFADELKKQVENKNHEGDDNHNKEISNPLSGSGISIIFEDDNGNTLSVPNDAWVRITPKQFQQNGDWRSLRCKVEANENLSNTCYIDGDENEFLNAFNDPNSTYEFVIFKNHKNPDRNNWECGEDVYKYVGNNLSKSDLSVIIVTPSDYQDESNETCNDDN